MKPTFAEKLDMWEKLFRSAIELEEILESPVSLKYEAMLELIAAARRSIPRPISEAPRDGTAVVVFVPSFYQGKGGWIVAVFDDGKWWEAATAFEIEPTEFIPIPEPTDGTV